ncbi:MAG TPA: hypothetical protein VM030_05640 [Acidimicrobiales bacterium]|nr:hypothetical protein [Acidimicrobiales bacterium]
MTRRLTAVAALAALVWLMSTAGSPVEAQIFPTTTSTSEPSSTTTPTIRPTTTTRPGTTTSRPGSTTSSTGAGSTSSTAGRSTTTASTTSTTATSRSTVPNLPPVSLSPAEAEEAPPEAQGSGDISSLFPLLSLLGFAVAGAMVGLRWWHTRE